MKAGEEHNFDTLRAYELTLRGGSPNVFRGFLIRLGDPIEENDFPPRTTFAFTINDDETQLLMLCETVEMVGGITHKNKLDKENITTMIKMDERAVGMTLDVTVVVRNNDEESLYYYSNFTMNALDVTASPSMSPTNPDGTTNPPVTPTAGPSAAPTSAPTTLPTVMPTMSSAAFASQTSVAFTILGSLMVASFL
uniref:Uncharacterized protein n=1 Tax=Grammatophora oceanica TaxID=210454 RepID=A0A7S1UKW6_9STRA